MNRCFQDHVGLYFLFFVVISISSNVIYCTIMPPNDAESAPLTWLIKWNCNYKIHESFGIKTMPKKFLWRSATLLSQPSKIHQIPQYKDEFSSFLPLSKNSQKTPQILSFVRKVEKKWERLEQAVGSWN